MTARKIKIFWIDRKNKMHYTTVPLPPSAKIGHNWWKKKALLPKALRIKVKEILGWQ